MKFLPFLALAFGVAACNSPPLEELSPTGPTSLAGLTAAADGVDGALESDGHHVLGFSVAWGGNAHLSLDVRPTTDCPAKLMPPAVGT